jgi:GDP/UDP-N,N'-diacetylbacillosamine 2-epimerase (hydrolysing)
MKVGVLTSARSDYGNYRQLLRVLNNDIFFNVSLIVFGTHLSHEHGYTVSNIYDDGYYERTIEIDIIPKGDDALSICKMMGETINKLSTLWSVEKFDLVFCLGDRFEMFAACSSTIPFNIPLAHISGGEETLGAIDDKFRHSITSMSKYHFTTTEVYRNRVINIKSNNENVYNVGSLNIDNLNNTKFLSKIEFKECYNIDLNLPSILFTFHPETISFEKNKSHISEIISALKEITGYQFIITMPNADTMNGLIRNELNNFISECPNAIGIESFGSVGYFSCIKYCAFMLGNTSSGFVEAGYFKKFVINLGQRQQGRIVTDNIINCEINKDSILTAINQIKDKIFNSKITLYGEGGSAEKISEILKTNF